MISLFPQLRHQRSHCTFNGVAITEIVFTLLTVTQCLHQLGVGTSFNADVKNPYIPRLFLRKYCSSRNVYINQATLLPSLSTMTSSGGETVSSAAAATAGVVGASLTLRRVSVRCGSSHVPLSMRAQIAALSSVVTASAI